MVHKSRLPPFPPPAIHYVNLVIERWPVHQIMGYPLCISNSNLGNVAIVDVDQFVCCRRPQFYLESAK